MSPARSFASRLLGAMARLSPSQSRPWADAMLRELDFVESDWGALRWAMGSATALLRHAAPRLWRLALARRVPMGDLTFKDLSTKTTGFLSGVVCSGAVLFLCAGPLARLVPVVVPSASRMGQLQLVECSIAFALPEMAFAAAAVALWGTRRSVATGILMSAVTLIAHLIIHFSTYGWLS